MWTKIKNYFYTAWYEEYELTVWFDNGVITDEDGNEKPKAKTKKIFKLKDEALKSTDVSDAIAVAWCGANRKLK